MRRNALRRDLCLLAAVMMLAASLPVSAFAQELPAAVHADAGGQSGEEAPPAGEDAAAAEAGAVEDAASGENAEEAATRPATVEEPAAPAAAPAEPEAAPEKENSAAQGVAVNETNFPDAAFRAWLLRPENLNGAGADGLFTEAELQAVTAINVSNQGIASLQGIEHFTQLKSLNASGNQMTSLTLKLPVLEGLYVAYNQLTMLDVTGCPKLVDLNFEMNLLTQVDLSGNPELVQLYSRHNLLTSLDMSHNPKLEDSGFVGRNNDLRTLILPNVPGLQVDTEDFLEQDPIVGSERSEWFYDSQYTQPIREKYIPGNGQTVYARRVPNRYTVRFSANGGAGSMDSVNTEYGQQVSSLGGKKRDGDKADLYAQWKANSYTIRYEAGEGQGSMEPTQARYNTEVKLAGCAFSKEGSVFAGWSTRPGGPVQYTDGQTVKNLTAE
ncbi:InlB B-repeat-containing protein [Fournierella sp.]|uniref:InlB B-repeat-containing protein n=1 Tax=Allofournierella sp. TaxID=1940256 RepID=UPI003079F339